MLVYLADLTLVQARGVLQSFPFARTKTREELLKMCRTTVRKFQPFIQDPDMFSFDVPWMTGERPSTVRNLMRNVKLADLTSSQLHNVFMNFTPECGYTDERLLRIAEELYIQLFAETPLKTLVLSVPGPSLTDMPADIIFSIYNTLPPGQGNISNAKEKLALIEATRDVKGSRSTDRQRFRSACRQLQHLLKPNLDRPRRSLPFVRLRDQEDSLAYSSLMREMNLEYLQELDLVLSYTVGPELTLSPMPVLAGAMCYIERGVECPTISVLPQMSLTTTRLWTLHILLDGQNTVPVESQAATIPHILPTLMVRELRITIGETWKGRFPNLAVSFPELNELSVRVNCPSGGLTAPIDPSFFDSCRQSLKSISIEGRHGSAICTMDDISKLKHLQLLNAREEFVNGFSRSALHPRTHWLYGYDIDEALSVEFMHP